MHDSFISGNGNGNKMNLRMEIIENLLNASGDGTSAKINSLRQAIRRNKSDMADNTAKSLDVLRQVFQHEMTDEIRQIIDRHLRTTFAPAFENLKRNGHEVSQTDINDLCISILDGAKEPFLSKPPNQQTSENGKTICIPSYTVLKTTPPEFPQKMGTKTYESDDNESDGSMVSYSSTLGVPSGAFGFERGVDGRPKKRGRPRKIDVDSGRSGTPIIQGTQPVTTIEALKWSPERVNTETRFVLGSKVNKILGSGHRNHIFGKYSRSFRYTADDEDKAWLFDRNISTRMSGKVFFMILEDCLEIAQMENASPQAQADLKRYSFLAHEKLIMKIKHYMAAPFEKLKSRVVAVNPLTPQQQSHQQPLSQQHPPQLHPQTMAGFTNFI